MPKRIWKKPETPAFNKRLKKSVKRTVNNLIKAGPEKEKEIAKRILRTGLKNSVSEKYLFEKIKRIMLKREGMSKEMTANFLNEVSARNKKVAELRNEINLIPIKEKYQELVKELTRYSGLVEGIKANVDIIVEPEKKQWFLNLLNKMSKEILEERKQAKKKLKEFY